MVEDSIMVKIYKIFINSVYGCFFLMADNTKLSGMLKQLTISRTNQIASKVALGFG